MKSGPSEESHESPNSSMDLDAESPFPGWDLGPQSFYSGNIIADMKRLPQAQPSTLTNDAESNEINLETLADQPAWNLGHQNFYPQVDIAKKVWASRER